ncbi:MGA_1079 family surface serine endopeptidase [Mycoplasma leonicaptivi]|uniref:MGA_1079 family surface serine endopeptidase n=1 Tax=Mycoplasma leonicaptivi TaxID=36742 RepID=UPI000686ADCE|nr:hypothetical protein [Mycoplasma leonicaptivi]
MENNKKNKKRMIILGTSITSGLLLIGGLSAGIVVAKNKKISKKKPAKIDYNKEQNKNFLIQSINEIFNKNDKLPGEFKNNLIERFKTKNTQEKEQEVIAKIEEFANKYQTLANLKDTVNIVNKNDEIESDYVISKLNLTKINSDFEQLTNSLKDKKEVSFEELLNITDNINSDFKEQENKKQELMLSYNNFKNSIMNITNSELKNQTNQILSNLKIQANEEDYLSELLTLNELINQTKSIIAEYDQDINNDLKNNVSSFLNFENAFFTKLNSEVNKLKEIKNQIEESAKELAKNNTKLNELKTNKKTAIDSLKNIDQTIKTEIKKNIDQQLTENLVNETYDKANSLNNISYELLQELNKKAQLQETTNFENSDNKEQIVSLFNEIQSKINENNELIFRDDIKENNLFFIELTELKDNLKLKISQLNGDEKLNNAKNETKSEITIQEFSDNLIQNLNQNIDSKLLVNEVLDIKNKIILLKNSLSSYKSLLTDFNQTINNSKITESDRNLLNGDNTSILEFLSEQKLANLNLLDLSNQTQDFSNKISKLATDLETVKQNIVNTPDQSQAPADPNFQTRAQQALVVNLDEQRLNKYDIKRYLTSASFNMTNAKLWLTEPKHESIKYSLKNINLDNTNKNIIVLDYDAVDKLNINNKAVVQTKIEINNTTKNINTILQNISISSLEDYFDIDYDAFKDIYEDELTLENIKSNITQNKSYIGEYFTFKIKDDANFVLTSDEKIQLTIGVYFNETELKTLTATSHSALVFNQREEIPVSISLSEEFKNSDLYKNNLANISDPTSPSFWSIPEPYGGGGIFNEWFYKKVFVQLKNENSNFTNKNPKKVEPSNENDPVYLTQSIGDENPTNQNELSKTELDSIFNKLLSNNKLFTITKPEGSTVEFLPIMVPIARTTNSSRTQQTSDEPRRFKIIASDGNASAIFKIKVTYENKSRELEIKIGPKNKLRSFQTLKDQSDEQRIKDILADKTGAKLFEKLKIKNTSQTHGHHSLVEGNPTELLNSFYNFPKIGRYEIFAKQALNPQNLKGEVDIFFWYKEDGEEVPIITEGNETEHSFINKNLTKIKNWKPVQYRDIKPKNNSKFDSSDFNPISTQYFDRNTGKTVTEPNNVPQDDINLINKINSRHFEYKKATAEAKKGTRVQYRLIDPQDIVDQNAQLMLNYVLTIKNTPTEADPKPAGNNNDFKNENPSEVSNPDGSKQNNEPSAIGGLDIVDQQIFMDADPSVDVDTNSLFKKYFVYFYDVQTTSTKGQMQFKLGFISKTNTNVRYTSNQTITLQNLTNDYKTKLYPEVILNNIKHSDLVKVANFNTKLASNLNENNFSDYFTIADQALTYNNFALDKANLKVAEIKKISGSSAYIRLKYSVGGKTINGSIWYKIDGFATASTNNENESLNISKWNSLTTVFNSANSITRTRILEPYYKDLIWTFNNVDKSANWLLQNKYIDQTLLKPNTSNRKLKIHLFGNTLVQNAKRLSRIVGRGQNEGYDFVIDFEKLMQDGSITINSQTSNVYYETRNGALVESIPFALKATYNAQKGIEFKFWLTNSEYGLLLDNPGPNVEKGVEFYNYPDRFDKFDKTKAFLLSTAAASVSLEYTNSDPEENFNVSTNKFDYNNIDFNQEGEPITFYSDEKAYDLNKYNPNQNVSYKLHNGYLQNNEFMHKTWSNNVSDAIKNSRARTFGFSFGSATMFAKVNKDPRDGKFYVITNNHVEAGHNFNMDSLVDDNLPNRAEGGRYMAIAAPDYANNIDAGFSYWGGLYNVGNVTSQIVWTGLKQKDVSGNGGSFVDITVTIVDINPLIKQARKNGEFLKVAWLEKWFTLPDLKLETNGRSNISFYAPNIKHFAINGFPLGKQNGYIVNRADSQANTIVFSRQNGYVQTFFNPGNSGTGVIGADNTYISTINSGSPLLVLQSWTYSNDSHNFFGINWKGENPLDLNNTYSLGANIMRMNAKNPNLYALPWYLRDFDNE